MMYFLPKEFGHHDCLHPVSLDKMRELKNRLEDSDSDEEEDERNISIFEEYFHYVMESNGLNHPSSITEAGVLFEKLVRFACSN